MKRGKYVHIKPILFVVVLFALACGGESQPTPPIPPPPTPKTGAPPLDPSIFPQVGDTEFLTANEREQLSAGTGDYRNGVNGQAELDSDGAAAAGDPGVSPPPAVPEPEPLPDVTREIVEADIFKLEGDLLYVLNRYRGLVIIDVKDPDKMFIRGRLPFQAMPVEMYVREGRAYVISSDYFVYWQYDPEADPHGFHGSQVLIADVSKPDAPKKLGSLHVDGEVTDTRMVGDVLYAVSKRRPDYWRYNTADWEDRTWIVSLNMKDPKNPHEIDRIDFKGMSTLIHVAHHAIFVAAWDPNFYLTAPGMEQETLVTYVDISDPTGVLRRRGKVYIPGQIADKFKMDWHEGHFRVFSQRRYTDGGIGLHIVPTAAPDKLQIAKSLDFPGVRYSGLQATRFSGERAFLFWREYVTGDDVRHLNTVDLSNPVDPRISADIIVPLDASHIEVHGDRLLALGRHYLHYTNTRVALALYDVADLSSPRELTLARLGEGSSSSEANHDYKALKTFPQLEMILVPLRYWVNGTSFSGLQIVDWQQDTLIERGRVENTGGVRRAFPVKDRLVAVGEMAIVSIDAQDRDRPQVKGKLRLVHHVHDVFEFGGKQVQLVTDVYTQQVRLEVREFGSEDDSPPIAQLDLPYSSAPFVLRDGDVLHMLGREPNRGQVVHNADLSNPTAPLLRGDLLLTDNNWTVYHPGWGWYYYYWSPYAGLPLRNQIIPATFRKVIEQGDGRREWQSEMRFLDLRNIDNPRVANGTVPMNDFPFINKVTHGNILYSTHVEQATTADGDSLLYHVRSYVDRVDVSDPDNPKVLPSVNVPGYLVDVSDDGQTWFTVDYQWDDFGRRRNSLNALKLIGRDRASLISVVPVSDQVNRAARRPAWLAESGGRPAGWSDRTLWLTAHKYPWWGVNKDTVASRQPYTVIRRVDFDADGRIAADSRTSFEGYHFNLLDVQQSQMVLSTARPSGIITVDLSNMGQPEITHTARTISYVGRVLSHGDELYAPLGYFGLQSY